MDDQVANQAPSDQNTIAWWSEHIDEARRADTLSSRVLITGNVWPNHCM